MLPIHHFQTGDHANMVGDQTRMDLFYQAITEQVKPGMIVAEVGTGTGILSAYAASKTDAPIYAIEFDESSATLAEKMFSSAGFHQVSVFRGKSFDLSFPKAPDLLITETIGAIGPEENLIEICHDLKKRYPSIKNFIPSRLKIFAEPIASKSIQLFNQQYFTAFDCASFGNFDYQHIRAELEESRCSQVHYGSLKDAKSLGAPFLLADYLMGTTENSSVKKSISLEDFPKAEAIHLYFEATLSDSVLLSSHYSKPETHWRHAYVPRPAYGNHMDLSYSTGGNLFHASWNQKAR